MVEVFGNLWEQPADVKVITTNGALRRDGACVMGRGTALQAAMLFKGVEHELGALIGRFGNKPFVLAGGELVSFPVKRHWKERALPELIQRSAADLVTLAQMYGWEKVAMPRPGCGNGGLRWADVKPLVDWLDDRFIVVQAVENKTAGPR